MPEEPASRRTVLLLVRVTRFLLAELAPEASSLARCLARSASALNLSDVHIVKQLLAHRKLTTAVT